jgi:uncharacterized protein (DUF58 family)
MIHPTARAALVAGAGAPVLAAAVLVWPQTWVFGLGWGVAILVLLAVDAVVLMLALRVECDVATPGALHVGERDEITLTLRARARCQVRTLIDLSGPAQGLPERSVRITPGSDLQTTMPLAPYRRGTIVLERLWLGVSGPLGLITAVRRRPLDASIVVLPNIRAVRREVLQFWARDSPFGMKQQHQRGSGTEFDALREWVPGLDPRTIDWKHSARHRKLVSKEFQTERNHHIVLALDTGHLMAEPVDGVPRLDRAVTALLLLAYVSLHAGDRVGVFAFDARAHTFAAPTGGLGTMTRLQHAMAALDYSHDETNFTLGLAELSGRLRRRSLIIVASDFIDTVTAEMMIENVTRLTRRHLVVFVALSDPDMTRLAEASPETMDDVARAVIAHDMLRERREVFLRLERLGVLCVDAPAERIGADLLNRYIAIKSREMI